MPCRAVILSNCTKVCRSIKLVVATAMQPENADTVKSLRISCFLQFPHGLNQFLNINNKYCTQSPFESWVVSKSCETSGHCSNVVNHSLRILVVRMVEFTELSKTSGRFPVWKISSDPKTLQSSSGCSFCIVVRQWSHETSLLKVGYIRALYKLDVTKWFSRILWEEGWLRG